MLKTKEFSDRVKKLEYQRGLIKAMQRATARGARVEIVEAFEARDPETIPPGGLPPRPARAEPVTLGQSVAEDCLQNEAERIDNLLASARGIEEAVAEFARGAGV